MDKLRGAIGVTVTPFHKDFTVDLDTVRKQAEQLAQSDIAGIFPCASTGEFPHLTMEQQRAMYVATREGVAGRKTLIAGACASSLWQAIAYANMAAELHYDACVACPPFYYPLTQPEVYAFYSELAKASPVPVIMYHVPFFTTGIEMDTVEKLMQISNIVGIKDSSANMKRIAHLCQLHSKRADFLVYTGTDDCLLPALAAGVDGSMTAFAACAPKLVAQVYDAFARKDFPDAAKAQQKMMPLLKVADALPFPLGYKLVAERYHSLPVAQAYHQLASEQAVQTTRAQLETLMMQALQQQD